MRNINESKQGFWGSLARKAKSILEDDNAPQQVDSPGRAPHHVPYASTKPKVRIQSSIPTLALLSKKGGSFLISRINTL